MNGHFFSLEGRPLACRFLYTYINVRRHFCDCRSSRSGHANPFAMRCMCGKPSGSLHCFHTIHYHKSLLRVAINIQAPVEKRPTAMRGATKLNTDENILELVRGSSEQSYTGRTWCRSAARCGADGGGAALSQRLDHLLLVAVLNLLQRKCSGNGNANVWAPSR